MIAIVYPQFFQVSGIARYVESFLANLPAQTPRIVLITIDEPGHRPIDPRVEVMRIPNPTHRLGLLTWSLRVRRLLAQWRREGELECINLHTPPMIPALLIGGGPLVWTAHTTYWGMSGKFEGNRNFDNPWNPLGLWFKIQIEKLLLARAQRVIGLTEQGRQELACYGDVGKVSIVPNGVDISRFDIAGDAPPKDIDVIFAGRIEKRKGSRPMVEVCKRLVAARPGIRIAIVGYGDDDAYVNAELSRLPDNVILAGKVPFDQMVSYYRRSRVYAATSYYEGLPGTCLEAMAVGLPAVTWDLLFYSDLVVEGRTGSLAAPNDLDGMTSAVVALLDDPKRATELGANGRELVRHRYDWRRLSREVLDVLLPPNAAGSTVERAAT